jgi:cardiolipin synthase (CMP-forming)
VASSKESSAVPVPPGDTATGATTTGATTTGATTTGATTWGVRVGGGDGTRAGGDRMTSPRRRGDDDGDGARPAPTSPGHPEVPAKDALAGIDPVLGITEGLARDRIWTVPNALSVLRLLGVPLFLWLLLGPEADGWAILVLALAGLSDWADGKLARLLDQGSRLGTLLDPAADRLYIVAALTALALRDIVPLWLVALLVAREVVLAGLLLVLRRYGYPALQVHYLGKAATFILLYAFPLLLLAHADGPVAAVVQPIAWALTIWGTVLYLVSGALYAIQVVRLVRAERALRTSGTAS